jgi:hypothetical protein
MNAKPSWGLGCNAQNASEEGACRRVKISAKLLIHTEMWSLASAQGVVKDCPSRKRTEATMRSTTWATVSSEVSINWYDSS